MKFKKKQPEKMYPHTPVVCRHNKCQYVPSLGEPLMRSYNDRSWLCPKCGRWNALQKFKRSKKMNETLTIKKDMVEKAMEKCPQFKEVAEELWPELKKPKIESYKDISLFVRNRIHALCTEINDLRFAHEGDNLICSKYILTQICQSAISTQLTDMVRVKDKAGLFHSIHTHYKDWK